jgi:hypothetical protein
MMALSPRAGSFLIVTFMFSWFLAHTLHRRLAAFWQEEI